MLFVEYYIHPSGEGQTPCFALFHAAKDGVSPVQLLLLGSEGNDHIIEAIRCALLIREEESLDLGGEEEVSLKPVFTDPVFT